MERLKIIILVFSMIVAFGAGYRWRDLGATADTARVAEAHAKEVSEYESRAREASDKAAAELARKQQEVADIDKRHTEDLANAQIQIDKLRNSIDDGTLRLSIPTRSPAPNCLRSDGTTTTTSVGDGKARADIDPKTSKRIIGITNDGDKAIRQLAACQDYVKAIRVNIK